MEKHPCTICKIRAEYAERGLVYWTEPIEGVCEYCHKPEEYNDSKKEEASAS